MHQAVQALDNNMHLTCFCPCADFGGKTPCSRIMPLCTQWTTCSWPRGLASLRHPCIASHESWGTCIVLAQRPRQLPSFSNGNAAHTSFIDQRVGYVMNYIELDMWWTILIWIYDELYCPSFKFLVVQLVIPISVKKIRFQANLRRLGLGPHRLACVIYEG
jgi:hypothetical protein